MITTIHARPYLHAALRALPLGKIIVCPQCFKLVGAARGAWQTQELLSAHHCHISPREVLQPSTAVPFS